MRLYGYWRSSAAYRVRIALNLKGLHADPVVVDLVKDGGENRKPGYLSVNPSGKLPSLELDDGRVLGQSFAILSYLDAVHPEPPLLPADPFEAAEARAFALTMACDIHPIQNSRVLTYLKDKGGFDDQAIVNWVHEWIGNGFDALEKTLERRGQTGPFAFGETPGLAEICLVPQMYNARRFGLDLSRYPKLVAVDAAACALPAFEAAAPERQPDAPAAL